MFVFDLKASVLIEIIIENPTTMQKILLLIFTGCVAYTNAWKPIKLMTPDIPHAPKNPDAPDVLVPAHPDIKPVDPPKAPETPDAPKYPVHPGVDVWLPEAPGAPAVHGPPEIIQKKQHDVYHHWSQKLGNWAPKTLIRCPLSETHLISQVSGSGMWSLWVCV